MADPNKNLRKAVISPAVFTELSAPLSNLIIAGPSPTSIDNGPSAMALNRFVYQDNANALPLTTLRLFLITTEWSAVMAELTIPDQIPTGDRGVPSRNIPTKNPTVTIAQATRMRGDGRACSSKKDVATVKGRIRPRATW